MKEKKALHVLAACGVILGFLGTSVDAHAGRPTNSRLTTGGCAPEVAQRMNVASLQAIKNVMAPNGPVLSTITQPPSLGQMSCLDQLMNLPFNVHAPSIDINSILNSLIASGERAICNVAQQTWNQSVGSVANNAQSMINSGTSMVNGVGSGAGVSITSGSYPVLGSGGLASNGLAIGSNSAFGGNALPGSIGGIGSGLTSSISNSVGGISYAQPSSVVSGTATSVAPATSGPTNVGPFVGPSTPSTSAPSNGGSGVGNFFNNMFR